MSNRDHTPKPVKNIPTRAEMKKNKIPLVKLIKVPGKAEQKLLEKAVKFLPFLIMQYGKNALNKLTELPLPSPLPFIFKWTARGIGYAADRFSVEQK